MANCEAYTTKNLSGCYNRNLGISLVLCKDTRFRKGANTHRYRATV